MRMARYILNSERALEAIHVLGELGLEVVGLVLVNHVVLGQFVKHAYYFRILLVGDLLFGGVT